MSVFLAREFHIYLNLSSDFNSVKRVQDLLSEQKETHELVKGKSGAIVKGILEGCGGRGTRHLVLDKLFL